MANDLTSEAARALSKLGAAKGGRARANVLTASERSEIASSLLKHQRMLLNRLLIPYRSQCFAAI
jgi:hypothetical protein